jgi:hypothetical protein|tara:strand:- start:647 stop:850 length:204 start_codon:yes stop_codon:yes gene_type:complete
MVKDNKSDDFRLGEIHAHVKQIPKIHADVTQLKSDVAVLKYKSSMWGAIGGSIMFVGIWLYKKFGGS